MEPHSCPYAGNLEEVKFRLRNSKHTLNYDIPLLFSQYREFYITQYHSLLSVHELTGLSIGSRGKLEQYNLRYLCMYVH